MNYKIQQKMLITTNIVYDINLIYKQTKLSEFPKF